jgi:hypothetical protein
MPEPDRTSPFATRLLAIKQRSNRSYETLARRVGASSSSLHRYCRGMAIPSNYDVIARFVRACGATEEEVADLRRAWTLVNSSTERFDRVAAYGPALRIEPRPILRRNTWPHGFALLGLALAAVTYLARRSTGRGSTEPR